MYIDDYRNYVREKVDEYQARLDAKKKQAIEKEIEGILIREGIDKSDEMKYTIRMSIVSKKKYIDLAGILPLFEWKQQLGG